MKSKFNLDTLVKHTKGMDDHGVVRVSFGVKDKVYGLWDLDKEEMVRDFEFHYISPRFIYGLAVAITTDDKVGIIREDGTFFIEPSKKYDTISIDRYGVIILTMENGRYEMMSAKTLKLMTKKTFASIKPVWQNDELSVFEVKVGDHDESYDVGAIRSDGVWLAKPEYCVSSLCDDYLLMEDDKGHGVLIDILNNMPIIEGERISRCFIGDIDAFCHSTTKRDDFVLVILRDRKVDKVFTGYKTVRQHYGDLLVFVKNEYALDVYSLKKGDFVLKGAVSFYGFSLIDEFFKFETELGCYGIISKDGEILLEATADEITKMDTSNLDISDHFLEVYVDEHMGIWNGTTREWVLNHEWKDVVYDGPNFFWAGKLEKVGFFKKKKMVWRLFNDKGVSMSEATFLGFEKFGGDDTTKVLNMKGKECNLVTNGEDAMMW